MYSFTPLSNNTVNKTEIVVMRIKVNSHRYQTTKKSAEIVTHKKEVAQIEKQSQTEIQPSTNDH